MKQRISNRFSVKSNADLFARRSGAWILDSFLVGIFVAIIVALGKLAWEAATATSCANSENAEVTVTQASSSNLLTTVSTTSSPTTTGPKVREGGTPRIGQLCPNQTGEIRMSANGQNLECAQVGEQEVWTVLQQTPANPTSQQMWISTTSTTSEPQPQEPEPTTPSESTTETSEAESSTSSDASTPPTTSTTPTTSGEPTDSESEQEERPSEANQGLSGLSR